MSSSSRVEATVVVPCLNGGRVLGACLAALDAQTVRDSLRVIVADGGSIDDSVARAREAADDVVTTTDPGIWGPETPGSQPRRRRSISASTRIAFRRRRGRSC